MSRYGKTPITIPGGVEVKQQGLKVTVKGPKGELSVEIKPGVEIHIEGQEVKILLKETESASEADHGLYRSLINNMAIGVSKGFEKKLTLVGVGYRAAVMGADLDLQLGFSHPCRLPIPKSLKVEVEKSTAITIRGCDKQEVGQFAAAVRAVRPPEPYKGKGVRYDGEFVRKKAGKAAKGKA